MNSAPIQIHPSATLVDRIDRPRPTGGWLHINFWRPPVGLVKLAGYSVNAVTKTTEDLISASAAVYTQKMELVIEDREEHKRLLADMAKTKLGTPLEVVNIQFLISGVTRAFTHQMVRYRIGTAFVQLSMRTSGVSDEYHVLIGNKIKDEDDVKDYIYAATNSIWTYDNLTRKQDGITLSEDSRGLMPTNILTGIYCSFTLRTLMNIFNQRLCCQAQPGEWQPILFQMRQQIREALGDNIAEYLRSNWERNKDCGFHASIDAPCRWRGNPISKIADEEWHLPYTTGEDLKTGDV